MFIDPYRSKYDLARELSDYQIKVLLLLQMGCRVITTEGAGFKVWLENMANNKIDFRLRKDTLNTLYGWGLLKETLDRKNRYGVYPYELTKKGWEVLNIVPDTKRIACYQDIQHIDLGELLNS